MRLTGSYCKKCNRKLHAGGVPCGLCGDADAVLVELDPTGVVESFTTVGEDARHVGEVRLTDGTLVIGRLAVAEPRVGLTVTQDTANEGLVFVDS